MTTSEVLADAFERILQTVNRATADLDASDLAFRPDADANSIGWLIWHLIRVQDHHVSELAGSEQTWIAGGWADRFAMPADPSDIGYGHSSEQVAGVRPGGPDVLIEYAAAVTIRTMAYVHGLDAAELDRIVDRSWDPPVTAGVRLVSVINDCMQHAGQASYARGLLERSTHSLMMAPPDRES